MIGSIDPAAPKNIASWPTYPLFLIDDVPLNTFRGALIRGSPESFIFYAGENSRNWVIRSKELRPLDDPFSAYLVAIGSPQWPFPRVDPNHGRFAVPYLEDEGYLLREVLMLVRTAYRPSESTEDVQPYINGLDYDRFHQEFLALGCHWDEPKQMYVRRDGSFTPDKHPRWPAMNYEFKGISRIHVDVDFYRASKSEISINVDCEETKGSPLPNAVLTVIDPSSGKELFWTVVNSAGFGYMSSPEDAALALTKPPHKPSNYWSGTGFTNEEGAPIQFALEFHGSRYTSGTFRP